MATVTLSDLRYDERLYPRVACDPVWVHRLCQHLQAGAQFPPILVDKNTMIVLDGWHRAAAYRAVYGDDADIPVEFVDAADDTARFLAALRANAYHGRPYSTNDIAQVVLRAEALGIARQQVADILHLSRRRLDDVLTQRVAYEEGTGQPIVLGRSWAPLAGQTLPATLRKQIQRSEGREFRELVRLLIKQLTYLPDEYIRLHASLLTELCDLIRSRL